MVVRNNGCVWPGKKTYIQYSFVAILMDVDSEIQTKSH